jgi:hypothetical protein
MMVNTTKGTIGDELIRLQWGFLVFRGSNRRIVGISHDRGGILRFHGSNRRVIGISHDRWGFPRV